MSSPGSTGYAFNRTRQAHLATQMSIAGTHWSRFRGLMWTDAANFPAGRGLWIVPCHGVHTFGMRFPIDVIYLNGDKIVVHIENELKPWRMAPVRLAAASVLELPGNIIQSTGTSLGDEIEIAVGKMPEAAGK